MQGALLILFPPTPASDWSCPSVKIGDILWDAFLAIRSSDNRQLNVITRGILIHPDLVNLWKQIDLRHLVGNFPCNSTRRKCLFACPFTNARASEITIITATTTNLNDFTKIFLDKENNRRFRVENDSHVD
ncbi:hypothetical protein RhiirA4_481067 [Rhizophagus irregularis]|uniref:Uncharacterized protein n=1 Tax=Rhizophagus irregularis TaxID=588596 RepID=A0A2I1HIW3_9GLOM|nr:hypothetical protein RhiirA4_481067 [Rhizophagus irregularis]